MTKKGAVNSRSDLLRWFRLCRFLPPNFCSCWLCGADGSSCSSHLTSCHYTETQDISDDLEKGDMGVWSCSDGPQQAKLKTFKEIQGKNHNCALGSSSFCAFPSSLYFLKTEKRRSSAKRRPFRTRLAYIFLIPLNYGMVGGKAAPAKQMSSDVNSFIQRAPQWKFFSLNQNIPIFPAKKPAANLFPLNN